MPFLSYHDQESKEEEIGIKNENNTLYITRVFSTFLDLRSSGTLKAKYLIAKNI